MASPTTIAKVKDACAKARQENWTKLAFVVYGSLSRDNPYLHQELLEHADEHEARVYELLAQGFPLEAIVFVPEPIGPDGAEHIRHVEQLTDLALPGAGIGDAGAAHLKRLTKLTSLNLDRNELTAAGPAHLKHLTDLTELDLGYNDLAAVPEDILSLPRLRCLRLAGNARLGLADEVLRGTRDPIEIRRLLRQAKRGDSARILACKIVLLGEPEAGKTWLRHRLLGSKPPPGRRETFGYDVGDLVITDVPPPPLPTGHPRISPDGTTPAELTRPVRVAAKVYDFGGQPVLHHSHRYFLCSMRNVFVVCVRADWSREKNKLDYWLELIRYEHEGHRARRRYLETRVRSPESGGSGAGHVAAPGAPRVIVVVTHSNVRGIQDQWLEGLKAEDLGERCAGLVEVVTGYDSGHTPDSEPTNLDGVRHALLRAVERLRELWSVFVHPGFNHVQEGIRQSFAFDQTSYNHPDTVPMGWLHTGERGGYRALFDEAWFDSRNGDALNEDRDPPLWLAYLRDIGHVQWVGDWPGVLAGKEQLAGDRVFNPAWVGIPVYTVARSHELARSGGIVGDEELTDLLRAEPDAKFGVLTHWRLDDSDVLALRALLRTTGLIVGIEPAVDKQGVPTSKARWLVLDHLVSAGDRAVTGEFAAAPLVATGTYDFLPDYALLPLVALWRSQWARRAPGAAATRDDGAEGKVFRDWYEEGNAADGCRALVRLVRDAATRSGGVAVEIRVVGGQDARERASRLAMLKDDVENQLGAAGEWRTVGSDVPRPSGPGTPSQVKRKSPSTEIATAAYQRMLDYYAEQGRTEEFCDKMTRQEQFEAYKALQEAYGWDPLPNWTAETWARHLDKSDKSRRQRKDPGKSVTPQWRAEPRRDD